MTEHGAAGRGGEGEVEGGSGECRNEASSQSAA